MTSPQEQFTELTRRTQEGFKHLWQQWSEKSAELMRSATGRSQASAGAGGNPEEVLDAVFDFAEHLIAQQRIFAKQMLAASKAQQSATQVTGGSGVPTSAAGAADIDPPRSAATRPGATTTGSPPLFNPEP